MEKDLEALAKEVLDTEYVTNGHSVEVTILIAMKKAIELFEDRYGIIRERL